MSITSPAGLEHGNHQNDRLTPATEVGAAQVRAVERRQLSHETTPLVTKSNLASDRAAAMQVSRAENLGEAGGTQIASSRKKTEQRLRTGRAEVAMDRLWRSGSGGFPWFAIAVVALWLSLQSGGSAKAVGFQEVRGIGGILSAISAPSDGPSPGLPLFHADDGGLPLWLVDLSFAATQETIDLGFGRCWGSRARLGQFAGFGASFPGLDALTAEEGPDSEGPPLTVGIWVGGGMYWAPSERLRVGVGLKWLPGLVTLSGSSDRAIALEAFTTAALRW